MKRRKLIQAISGATVAAMGATLLLPSGRSGGAAVDGSPLAIYEDVDASPRELAQSIRMMTTPAPDHSAYLREFAALEQPVALVQPADPVAGAQTYFQKMQNFERSHPEDVYVPTADLPLLLATFKRIDGVQSLVGHGNFNVLSFDDMLKFSRRYSRVGTFTREEVAFVDSLFHENAGRYGFFGDKVTERMTAVVTERERYKVPYTGHFLYRGASLDLYRKAERDLNNRVVLTSGIRSVVKQTHLFLAKTIAAKGNLSRASRSLAPPGHSYHGIGDFDVGKVGFGRKNFTTAFARTAEYRRLVDLGYIDMRYPEGNLLGVRYEPWHVQVV